MRTRTRLYRLLEPSVRDKGISTLNILLILLVLVSFLTFSLETEMSLSQEFRNQLAGFNLIVLAIFALEYVARVWVSAENTAYNGIGGRITYMLTPFAITDLLAFLPELLALIITAGDARAVAALKALRLFRLLKLARFVPAFGMLWSALKRSGAQLGVALIVALALIYVSAIIIYFIEGDIQPEAFGSIPRATWWAVATLTTVGYGDAYPITVLGKMFAGVIALAGIGVVALPAGIFASAVSDEVDEREKMKKHNKDHS